MSHYWSNLELALARIIADPLMLSAQFVFGFHSEESMKDFTQRVLSKTPSLFRFATIRYSLWLAPLASNTYGGVGWYKAALDTVKPKGKPEKQLLDVFSSGAMKRKVSPELTSRPSQYHSAVTLYEASSSNPISEPTPVLRRSKRVKVKEETKPGLLDLDDTLDDMTVKTEYVEIKKEVKSAKKPRKDASPRKPKSIPQSLAVPHPAPPHWKEAYDKIKTMRESIVAPVDTMGCHRAQLAETDLKNRRFSTLVSLMLSSQTKDEVTDAAVTKLRQAVGGTLSVEAILEANESSIAEAIAKVGFWRRKTQYIKQAAQKLRDEFDSDVPKTVDELCSLPGVGPKMAFLALQVAWNINVGIGVDVHVHRITNRLGWHKPPTKNPEETRLNLQSWLPVELHPEINHLLVGFGQRTKKTQRKSTTVSSRAGPKVKIEVEETITQDVSLELALDGIKSEEA
ncbi:hypothetical protein EIP86_002021 [Pleurotus ostreatoroseus]|nr:hypothetical protein EIP86_002021 [Pleurotus ostreatoroseus]